MRLSIVLALCLAVAAPACAENGYRWVAEPQFQDAGEAHHGIVPLKQGDVWGLMSLSGDWLVAPEFEAVGQPGNGWFPVKQGGKWGIVSDTGDIIAGFDYDEIGKPSLYTPMKFQGVWYALGPSNEFDTDALPFDTLIGNDQSCMLGSRNGTVVSASRGDFVHDEDLGGYSDVAVPSEGFIAVSRDGLSGHMDCGSGTLVGGTLGFDQAGPFSGGFAAVKLGQGWGYAGPYDAVLEFGGDWQAAGAFSEGLAPVKQDGRWGYVDTEGQMVIPPQFDRAYAFSAGIAGVELNGKRGFVLPDGSMAVPAEFDDFWRQDGGVAPVRKGDLWGVIAPAATDPKTRLNLPLQAVSTDATRAEDYTLQPSSPHYYSFQDIASIHSIFVTPDEKTMATTVALNDLAEIGLWDFTSHRLIRKLPLAEATQAVLLPSTEILAAGLNTGHVVLLNAVTGAELARNHPFRNAVIDMTISPDGKLLAAADGETIQIWDLGNGAAHDPIRSKSHKLRYSQDSATLFVGTVRGGLAQISPDGALTVITPEGPELEFGEGPFLSAVSSMALTAQGVLVNVRSVNEQHDDGYYYPRSWLEIVDAKGSRTLDIPEGMRDILTVDVSADGRTVAFAGQTEEDYVARVEVWDIDTGAAIFSQTLNQNDTAKGAGLNQFVYSVDRLGFAPKGGLVMVGMEGQDIVLLDPTRGKVSAEFAAPLVTSQASTALWEGDRFFSSDGTGQVWVWDLAQGRLEQSVRVADTGAGPEEMVEPDGNRFYLYSGLDDGVVNAFDMTTLAPVPLSTEEAAKIYAGLDYDSAVPVPAEVQAGIDALPADGTAVALAGGRIAVVSQPVGSHRAYDLKTGALLAEFLATPDGEWLVVTPEGFFAASPKGAALVSVSTGLRAFAVDQVYQALYRPDLVQAKLAGDPDGLVAKAAAELDLGRIMGSGPAPLARFSLPQSGAKAQSPDIDLRVDLQDEGGGIGKVEWRLNGVTVDVQPTRSATALEEDGPTSVAHLTLEPGDNLIEVVAYNAAGLLASAPQEMTVSWDGVASTTPPVLHVLAVGVNDYADGRLQLKYAAADAKAFADAMQRAGAGLFSSVDVMTLIDADVTAARLDQAFAEMGKRTKSQDVFLFFLAGHGKTIEGKYYFIPQDFRFQGDDPIRAGGINQDQWQEWVARIKARKSVMIYDTCESGSTTESRSVDAAMAQSAAVERLTRAMGRTVLSASSDDAPALEGYRGHGVMTWAMLDAFGQGDSNQNATIEVTELANYLDVKVPEISVSAFGMRQVPQMSIIGSDFALGSRVAVLSDATESYPATLTHVVAGGTPVLDAPGGKPVDQIETGVFAGVFLIEEKDGFARIAKNGKALGWVAATALSPLQ